MKMPKTFFYSRVQLVAIAVLGFFVLGCQLPTPPSQTQSQIQPTSSPQTSPQQDSSALAQYLPIEATTLLNGSKIGLEVARSPEQQALGLMYRTELSPDRGMIFPVKPPRGMGFWMKNTLIPLDIVFVRDQKVVNIHQNVPPCTTPQCPVYRSQGGVDAVIELAAGRSESLGLKAGDPVVVEYQNAQSVR